jgi:hypothetical protein
MIVRAHHLNLAVDGQVQGVVDHLGVGEEINRLTKVRGREEILAEKLRGVMVRKKQLWIVVKTQQMMEFGSRVQMIVIILQKGV